MWKDFSLRSFVDVISHSTSVSLSSSSSSFTSLRPRKLSMRIQKENLIPASMSARNVLARTSETWVRVKMLMLLACERGANTNGTSIRQYKRKCVPRIFWKSFCESRYFPMHINFPSDERRFSTFFPRVQSENFPISVFYVIDGVRLTASSQHWHEMNKFSFITRVEENVEQKRGRWNQIELNGMFSCVEVYADLCLFIFGRDED